MHSVPGEEGGVTVLKIVVKDGLEIHKSGVIFLSNLADNGTVFIHTRPHPVLFAGLHIIGRHQDYALYLLPGPADKAKTSWIPDPH